MRTVSSSAVKPLTGPAAARRAACLSAIVMRGEFEMVAAGAAQEKPEIRETVVSFHKDLAERINQWLKQEGLEPSLSQREAALLRKPFGTWTEQERIDSIWRLEALGVIAWAIGILDTIPGYDTEADEKLLVRACHFLRPTRQFVAGAKLRPAAEIRAARERAELWLWRARTTYLQREPERYPLPQGLSYPEVIAMTAEQAGRKGMFQPVDQDFPALGKSYASLTDEEWLLLRSIAVERLYGLNWLCGRYADWDRVPLDT